MSDFFFNSLYYGEENATRIAEWQNKVCEECGEKCSSYQMIHRGTDCPVFWRKEMPDDVIDRSKIPTPEEMGMTVIDKIGPFLIVVKKGTVLDKKELE